MGRILRAKETGLVAVILVLGGLLAFFGGSVTVKQRNPATGRVIGQTQVNKFSSPPTSTIFLRAALGPPSWPWDNRAHHFRRNRSVGRLNLLPRCRRRRDDPPRLWALRATTPTLPPSSPSPSESSPLAHSEPSPMGNGLMVVLLAPPVHHHPRHHVHLRGIAFRHHRGSGRHRLSRRAGRDLSPHHRRIQLRPDVARAEARRHHSAAIHIVVVVVTTAVGYVLLVHTVLGREIYAVGGNETACLFSGNFSASSARQASPSTLADLTGGIAAVIAWASSARPTRPPGAATNSTSSPRPWSAGPVSPAAAAPPSARPRRHRHPAHRQWNRHPRHQLQLRDHHQGGGHHPRRSPRPLQSHLSQRRLVKA